MDSGTIVAVDDAGFGVFVALSVGVGVKGFDIFVGEKDVAVIVLVSIPAVVKNSSFPWTDAPSAVARTTK